METAVVTLGERGVGHLVATEFVERGVHVVACSGDVDELDALEAEIDATSAELTTMRADVRDEFDVERFMETASRAGDASGIDSVVTAAEVFHGPVGETPIDEVSYAAFDDTVRTNVRGVFTTIREGLPHLTPGARVLVPSGEVARGLNGGYGVYAASKAGAEAIARQFAADTAWTVGVVDTGPFPPEPTDVQAGQTIEDIASLFWWAATDAEDEVLDGRVVDVDVWRRVV